MEWLSGSSSSAAVDRAAAQGAAAAAHDFDAGAAATATPGDPLDRVEARLQRIVDDGAPVAELEIECALVLVGLDVGATGISWRGICARERIRTLGDLDETLAAGEFESLFPEAVARRLRLARFLLGIAADAREPGLVTAAARTGAASTDDLVNRLDRLPVMYRARIRNRLRTEPTDSERSMADFTSRLADDVRLGLRFFVCGERPARARDAEPLDSPPRPSSPRDHGATKHFEFDPVAEAQGPAVDDSPDPSPVRDRRSSSAASEPPSDLA